MDKFINIIPKLKHVKVNRGEFCPKKTMFIRYSPGLMDIAERLGKVFRGKLPIKCDPVPKDEIIVGDRKSQKGQQWRNDEAYEIDVTNHGINLRGASEKAIFYAVITLEQLVTDSLSIPVMEIKDWPDLRIRAYHLDLKGAVPTVKFLAQFIQDLARLKINTLVIEYEDTFPFVHHSDLCSTGAFSSGELTLLLKLCRDNYIDTIPLLQSHGHVECILKKTNYAHLAEPGSLLSEFCPCNPGSIRLFSELADEILKYHGESRYFHVGGDEAYSMGRCPKCKQVVRKKGYLGLYIEHINRVFDIVMASGKVPIFWDDMLWMYGDFDSVKKLRPGAVACHWDYLSTKEKSPRFVWNRGWYISRKWLSKDVSVFDDMRHWRNLETRWIEDTDEGSAQFATRYWKGSSDNLQGESFAMIKFLTDQGIDVIGASVAKGGASCMWSFYPFFHRQAENIRLWALIATQRKLLGVINTGWSRGVSTTVPFEPLDMCWYLIVLAAQCYWDSREISRQEFDKLFNKVFLQTEDDAYTFAIRTLDAGDPLELAVQRISDLSVPTRRQNTVRHIELALKFAQVVQVVDKRISLVKHESYRYQEESYPRVWVAKRMNDLRKSKSELKSLAESMRKTLGVSLKPSDTEEFISSLIKWRVYEIDQLLDRSEKNKGIRSPVL